MKNLSACSRALIAFKEQYPSTTSADLQTFILGFTAGEEIRENIITDREVIIDARLITKLSDNRKLFLASNQLVITDALENRVLRTLNISMFLLG